MKRVLVFFFFLAIVTTSMVANDSMKGHVLDLTCSYENPTNKPVTRAPQAMPVVSVDGNTLFFNNSFFQDIVVQIKDNQGNIVFYDNVPYGINSIEIPTTISDGEYHLYIKTPTKIYEGILLLE
jgi:hypothetical protein